MDTNILIEIKLDDNINYCNKLINIVNNRLHNNPINIIHYTDLLVYNNSKQKCILCPKQAEYNIMNDDTCRYCWVCAHITLKI
jgi:formamidopyrimidine-DNA glycosylase